MKKANYTVEAVFVCSICIWVLLALMYGSFYVHDRMILGSVTNELTAEHYQKGDKKASHEWENEVKQKLSDVLFLIQIEKVETKRGLGSIEVEIKYQVPISVGGIKDLFSDKENSNTYVTIKELPEPMEYKWDADLLKKK